MRRAGQNKSRWSIPGSGSILGLKIDPDIVSYNASSFLDGNFQFGLRAAQSFAPIGDLPRLAQINAAGVVGQFEL